MENVFGNGTPLRDIAGSVRIDSHDPRWLDLMRDVRILRTCGNEESVLSFCSEFWQHNQFSGNFTVLLEVIDAKLSQAVEFTAKTSSLGEQCAVGLHLLTIILINTSALSRPSQLLEQFGSKIHRILEMALKLITTPSMMNEEYIIKFCALSLLCATISAQLFNVSEATLSLSLELIFIPAEKEFLDHGHSRFASRLVTGLLDLIRNDDKPRDYLNMLGTCVSTSTTINNSLPHEVATSTAPNFPWATWVELTLRQSVGWWLAWPASILTNWLTSSVYSNNVVSTAATGREIVSRSYNIVEKGRFFENHPLGTASSCFLALLLHNRRQCNPFREMFSRLRDLSLSVDNDSFTGRLVAEYDEINDFYDLQGLFRCICRNVASSGHLLLLYTLLQCNSIAVNVLVDSNELGDLMERILEQINQKCASSDRSLWNVNQLYVLTSIVLLLTQEPEVRKWCSQNLNLRDGVVLSALRILKFGHRIEDAFLILNGRTLLLNIAVDVREISFQASESVIRTVINFCRRIIQDDKSDTQMRSIVESVDCLNNFAVSSLRNDAVSNVQLLYAVVRELDSLTACFKQDNVKGLLAIFPEVSIEVERMLEGAQRILEKLGDFSEGGGDFCLDSRKATLRFVEILGEDNPFLELPVGARPRLSYRFEEGSHPEAFFIPHAWVITVLGFPNLYWHFPSIRLFDAFAMGFLSIDRRLDAGPSASEDDSNV